MGEQPEGAWAARRLWASPCPGAPGPASATQVRPCFLPWVPTMGHHPLRPPTSALRAPYTWQLIRCSYHPTCEVVKAQGTERLSHWPKVTQLQVQEPGFERKLCPSETVYSPPAVVYQGQREPWC